MANDALAMTPFPMKDPTVLPWPDMKDHNTCTYVHAHT